MTDRRMPIGESRKFIHQVLINAGADAENATISTDVFLEAELRGNFMQGIEHMPTMLRNIDDGNLDAKAKPKVFQERRSYALVDGCRGPGQVAAVAAADLLIANAPKQGAAAVGIRNSTDLYMLGYYTERIARQNLIGIGISSGAPNTHADGGTKRVLGTNPISVALPNAKHPLLVDMATSALSMSRVRHADFFGHILPEGSAIDVAGVETRDPSKAIAGALSPMAGHKGFALSLMFALICGPATGSGVGSDLTGWGWRPGHNRPAGMGHFFIAIDPFVYVEREIYLEAVENFMAFVRNSDDRQRAAIRIPGDRAHNVRDESIRSGTISINSQGWSAIESMAHKYKVPLPFLAPQIQTSPGAPLP